MTVSQPGEACLPFNYYVSTQSTVRSRLYARERKLDQDADLLTISTSCWLGVISFASI